MHYAPPVFKTGACPTQTLPSFGHVVIVRQRVGHFKAGTFLRPLLSVSDDVAVTLLKAACSGRLVLDFPGVSSYSSRHFFRISLNVASLCGLLKVIFLCATKTAIVPSTCLNMCSRSFTRFWSISISESFMP